MADPGSLFFVPCRPTEEEARRVMTWRNDPATLKAFYHREPKVWPDFLREFRSTYFSHPHLTPVFALRDGEPVAFLRFETAGEDSGEVDISINVAPARRGGGLGTRILRQVQSHLRTRGVETIRAEVRVENGASIRAFQKAGFTSLGRTTRHIEDTGETCHIERLECPLGPPAAARALLCDLDGTLAHSLPSMFQAYRDFLTRRGAQPTRTEFDRLNGPPLQEVVSTLRRTHGLEDTPARLLAAYEELVTERYSSIAAADGAESLLEAAAGLGYRLVLVTSNSRAIAEAWLRARRLDGLFDAVVAREDVGRGKPDPEPYVRGLLAVGGLAHRSLALEDSPAGATSAARAGLRVLVLGNPSAAGDWPEGATQVSSLRTVQELLHEQSL